MTDESLNEVRRAVERWQPRRACLSITPMTPDASKRSYFRIALDGESEPRTAVAVLYHSTESPEAGGGIAIRSDDAYRELTAFFGVGGVAVPEILFDARDRAVMILEDLGDRTLTEAAGDGDPNLAAYFGDAVDQIVRIQSLPPSSLFAFQRSFTAAQYIVEMRELLEFILRPRGASRGVETVAEETFASLAAELDALPRVLAHRDFHASNLLIGAGGRIRVIDFQDALLATGCYDLVSLLNDRDIDRPIGPALYATLLERFRTQHTRFSGIPRESFMGEYLRVLLQRDLKVAGRFAKLAAIRGLDGYLRWVPGTLERIGRTLRSLDDVSVYKRFFEAVGSSVPEIARGYAGAP